MIPALIVAVLIALNGLFVAAEFAIVGSSRARVERAARRGSRLAKLVLRFVSDPREQDRYIATAQLGITSASLGLGMYGEHLLAEWLVRRLEWLGAGGWVGAHALASVLAVTFLTYLHVVLGEMVPKSLALQSPTKVARAVAVPMRAIELALYPLVVGLNGIGNGVLRLMGIERTVSEERYRTVDELSFIVAESRAGGLLEREPARVVQELLEFGELTAGEVMVPRTRVVAMVLGYGREDVARVLAAERHTRFPVHEDDMDSIVGIVHVKDLLARFRDGGVLDRSMVREVPFLPATEPLERVLAVLRRTRSQMAVVLDEHGGTAGVLTLEDLFEEVVGDIAEPGETPRLSTDDEGRLSVAGTVRLDELGEALGLVLEHEEVDTVSGLVLAELGRPPEIGDVVEHEGVVLEVSAVRGKGVEQARVVSAPEPE
ncbi:MAG TPA: hemolysin family protein [Thermoanaerobaculia bacterium]|nr:hemolysin family protein [Thermoanaerobaculia bacterium]